MKYTGNDELVIPGVTLFIVYLDQYDMMRWEHRLYESEPRKLTP